jgi:hypothetical protein
VRSEEENFSINFPRLLARARKAFSLDVLLTFRNTSDEGEKWAVGIGAVSLPRKRNL